MAADNNYNYPLTTGQRGKIYISQSDPRNTVLGRARLAARYGQGNVIVVPDYELIGLEGAVGSIEEYSLESSSPIVIFNAGTTTDLPPAPAGGIISMNPPTNLVVSNYSAKTSADGSVSMDITISFDDVVGADSYETYVSSTTPSFVNQPVSISSTSVSLKTITVNWVTIANANNYVLSATLDNATYVYATAPLTGGTGTVTVPTGGSWTVLVKPYNSQGIAGPAATKS